MKRFGAALATVVLLAAAVLLSRNADQAGEDDAQDAAQAAALPVHVHAEPPHPVDRVGRVVLLDQHQPLRSDVRLEQAASRINGVRDQRHHARSAILIKWDRLAGQAAVLHDADASRDGICRETFPAVSLSRDRLQLQSEPAIVLPMEGPTARRPRGFR